VPTRRRRLAEWWLDRPLRSKGLAVLAPPILVLVITLAASFIVERYQAALRQTAATADRTADQAAQVEILALQAHKDVLNYAIGADPRPPLTASDTEAMEAALQALNSDHLTGNALSDVANATSLATDFWTQLVTVQSHVTDHSVTTAELQSLDTNGAHLQSALANIQTTENAVLATKRHEANQLQSFIQPVQISGLLIGVIGGVTAMVLFVRSIVRRISEADDNARRLGVSEPLLPIPPAQDEIGHLTEELNQTSVLLTQRSIDLVRAHAAAVESAEASSERLSRVSHELRTPLTAVMGFGQMIETSNLNEEDSEAVEQILHGGAHMLRIIEEAKTTTETPQAFDIDLRPVEVGPLVDEVQSLLLPLSAERQLTVTGCDDGDVAVLADYHRFKQVLINLISNAVKYNREGGDIRVSCGPTEDGMVRVAVTDTGDGIPMEMMDRVFVPFDRLGADQRGVEGTGIGLSLSKTFVEAMDGSMGVDSTVGVGSTFWVELPRAPDAPGAARGLTA
jgi:signal transduction histidine kinase